MQRLVPLLVCGLLFGCSGPSAEAPMLRVVVDGPAGGSRGLHRVERTGVLSESGEQDSLGTRVSQRWIVDEITDQAILLTIETTGSSAGDWSKQVRVSYDKPTVVRLPDNSTLTAVLERQE